MVARVRPVLMRPVLMRPVLMRPVLMRPVLMRPVLSVAAVLLGCFSGLVGWAVAGAGAQTCLPSPTLLFGEVARVAGTGSQLWADLQSVEQADGAAGTSASGQVIQDMLVVVNRDGYQWDCAGNRLTAPPGAPVSPSTTVPGTGAGGGQAATPASPGRANGSTTPTAPVRPGQGAPTTTTGSAASSAAGVTTPADTGVTTPAGLAASSTTAGASSSNVPTAVLVVFLLLSVAALVIVVRWQMARH